MAQQLGPACATCRRSCRRCDRTRPACKRCTSKGVTCGGYPDKYRFCGLASRGRLKDVDFFSRDEPHAERREKRRDNLIAREMVMEAVGDAQSLNVLEDSPRSSAGEKQSSENLKELQSVLLTVRSAKLLSYYDKVICPHQIAMVPDNQNNPYRQYIVPLAYEHPAPLHAILGLSACHWGIQTDNKDMCENEAIRYQLKAIRALAKLLEKEATSTLTEGERDALLVTIQILVLHDISESGVSMHGAHVSGSSGIGERLMAEGKITSGHSRMVFFLGNLAWLDVIRAFAGPERLSFSWDLMQAIAAASDNHFEMVNGCPREIFLIIGETLWQAKHHFDGHLSDDDLHNRLEHGLARLKEWENKPELYPLGDSLWPVVGEAFRYTCMIRVLRLIDPLRPAADLEIQSLVNALLDITAEIPTTSPLIELLVLPLFIAGADAMAKHSREYVIMRLDAIKGRSGFRNPASRLLHQVWSARAERYPNGEVNVPWMEFTRSTGLGRQDDYFII